MDVGTTRGCLSYNKSMKPAQVFILSLLSVFASASMVVPVMADGDHLEARRLLQSGEVMSLESILDKIRGRYPGRVIEVELEKKHGQIVYEIEIIDDNGRVHELYVNARNGELIRAREDD